MSFKDWFPPESREPFFGLDRGKRQLECGLWLMADINVSDIENLTWKERLLSWPWKPWVRYKKVQTAYFYDKYILVSYETYMGMKDVK